VILAIALFLAVSEEPSDIIQYRGTYANPATGICFSIPDEWVAEDVPGTTDTRVGGPLYGPGGTFQANVIFRVKRTSKPANLRSLAADMRSYLQELWHPASIAAPTFSKNKRGTPTAEIVQVYPSEVSGEPIKTVYSVTVTSSHVYVYGRATASVGAWPEYGPALTLIVSTVSACPSTTK
jgi:hypothetical protein